MKGSVRQCYNGRSFLRADLLPLVSSRHDVINRSRIFHTYRSCQDGIQPNPIHSVKIVRLSDENGNQGDPSPHCGSPSARREIPPRSREMLSRSHEVASRCLGILMSIRETSSASLGILSKFREVLSANRETADRTTPAFWLLSSTEHTRIFLSIFLHKPSAFATICHRTA